MFTHRIIDPENKGKINASVNDNGEATFSTENENPNAATRKHMAAVALSGSDNTMELSGSDTNIIARASSQSRFSSD